MPAPRSVEETFLLVEGPDDKLIIDSLLRVYNCHESIRIKTVREFDHPDEDEDQAAKRKKSAGGFEQLRHDIFFTIQSSGLKYYGVVVDADENPAGRWVSVRDRLRESGCNPPDELPHEGTVFEGPNGLRVGAWLMPNNKMVGAMEAFLRLLVPADDPNWSFAERCVDEIPKKAKDSNTWRDKARLYTWLAWQKQPGKPPESVLRSPPYLNANADVAQAFVGWVRRLFELE